MVDSPTAPTPPSSYTTPSPTGSIVTSFAEFQAEFAMSSPRVIVVQDGTYTGAGTTYLTTNDGHQVWAETQGGVTFDFGLTWAGNSGTPGGECHGINFDVSDTAKVDPVGLLNDAIILAWGPVGGAAPGNNLVIEDCTFNGNDLIGSGIQNVCPDGFVVRRCTMDNFLDAGISAFRNGTAGDGLTVPILIEDVSISNISRAVPGSGLGASAELGINIGHQATIQRVHIRDCAWAGIALVNDATDCYIRDYDIDDIGHGYLNPGSVGIYCEHSNTVMIIRGHCGPNMKVGINCEWNSGDPDPYVNTLVPRNYGIHVRHALIEAYKVGIHWDLSVRDCSAQDIRIERAWKAGVLDNNQFPDDQGDFQPPVDESPIYTRNAVDQSSSVFLLARTVTPYLHDHHDGSSAPPPDGWPADPADYDANTLDVVETNFDDTTEPTTTLVSPTDGNIEAATAVVFDVTEESTDGLCSVFVWAILADSGDAEVVHDGSSFAARYVGLSSRTPINGGFRYTVRRSGGWPSSPSIQVKAVDRAGNESS